MSHSIVVMEFPCIGASFLFHSNICLVYYLGSYCLSEKFVHFLRDFYSMQTYRKLTGWRRNQVVVIFGMVWILLQYLLIADLWPFMPHPCKGQITRGFLALLVVSMADSFFELEHACFPDVLFFVTIGWGSSAATTTLGQHSNPLFSLFLQFCRASLIFCCIAFHIIAGYLYCSCISHCTLFSFLIVSSILLLK